MLLGLLVLLHHWHLVHYASVWCFHAVTWIVICVYGPVDSEASFPPCYDTEWSPKYHCYCAGLWMAKWQTVEAMSSDRHHVMMKLFRRPLQRIVTPPVHALSEYTPKLSSVICVSCFRRADKWTGAYRLRSSNVGQLNSYFFFNSLAFGSVVHDRLGSEQFPAACSTYQDA